MVDIEQYMVDISTNMVENGEQYPLVNIQKTMERSTIVLWENQRTFDWAMASIAMLVYRRVIICIYIYIHIWNNNPN